MLNLFQHLLVQPLKQVQGVIIFAINLKPEYYFRATLFT